MSKHATAEQYTPPPDTWDKRALVMGGGFSDQISGVVKRLSLDVSERAYVALEQLALHRNAMASVRKSLLRRKQTRKSTAEAELERAVTSLLDDLAPMFEVCGDWPTPDQGDEAFEEYARRVVAMESKIAAAADRRDSLRKKADAGK